MLSINTDTLRAEVAAHIAADAVVQGHYWKDGKGCFIGCLAHSRDATVLGDRFGLPLPLVRICEGIFEALPADEAKAFFAAVPDAVGVDGKDLSRVHWAFLAEELRALPEVPPEVQAVIDPVIAGMDLLASGQKWPAAARAAARAAYAAYAAYAADAAAKPPMPPMPPPMPPMPPVPPPMPPPMPPVPPMPPPPPPMPPPVPPPVPPPMPPMPPVPPMPPSVAVSATPSFASSPPRLWGPRHERHCRAARSRHGAGHRVSYRRPAARLPPPRRRQRPDRRGLHRASRRARHR
jgi:hypothetical protein